MDKMNVMGGGVEKIVEMVSPQSEADAGPCCIGDCAVVRKKLLKVYVNPQEHNEIKALATEYGMSLSSYMRAVCTHPEVLAGATASQLRALRHDR